MAGPPCQPFSRLSGERKQPEYHPFVNDVNAQPVREVAIHIRDKQPKCFAIEEARPVVGCCDFVPCHMPSATCEVASFADSWPVQCKAEFFEKYKAVGVALLEGFALTLGRGTQPLAEITRQYITG